MQIKWKHRAAAVLAATVVAANVFLPTAALAEQAKAQEYRGIIQSGKFRIEYGTEFYFSNPKAQKMYAQHHNINSVGILLIDGDKRAYYAKGSRLGDTTAMANRDKPFFKKAYENSKLDKNKMYLNILYRDNKCYQLFGKNEALVTSVDNLSSLESNMKENWATMKMYVGLPSCFRALLPNSPYYMQAGYVNPVSPNLLSDMKYKSEFIESGQATVHGQSMNYDKYTVTFDIPGATNVSGGTETNYYYYYDNSGNLKYIKEEQVYSEEQKKQIEQSVEESKNRLAALHARGGKKANDSTPTRPEVLIRIDNISNDVQPNLFDFPVGLTVYAADSGSLEDLIGEPVVVEKY